MPRAAAAIAESSETEAPPPIGNKNDVVIVGCKLPTGFIMELIPRSNDEDWRPPPAGPRIKLKGANSVPTDTLVAVNPRVLQYGRTPVPRDFWERWLEANKDRDYVTKGFIFAEAKAKDFNAHAKENLPEKTGLEGLAPSGDDERLKNDPEINVPGHPETRVETDAQHLAKLQRALENVTEED